MIRRKESIPDFLKRQHIPLSALNISADHDFSPLHLKKKKYCDHSSPQLTFVSNMESCFAKIFLIPRTAFEMSLDQTNGFAL